jgi:hypothetical protein
MTNLLVEERSLNFLPPSRNVNVQLQSNQFVLPTQLQNRYDTFCIYPSVQSASNESMNNLKAEMGQSTANQPYRLNNDSLYNTLRQDRKSLDTMRANAYQNPYNVRNKDEEVPNILFTGGYEDDAMFLDRENREYLEEERLTKGAIVKMPKQKPMRNFRKQTDEPSLENFLPNLKVGLNIQSPLLGIRGENNSNRSNGTKLLLESNDVNYRPITMNREFERMKI